MTNEDYRAVFAVRLTSHGIELCDKVGTEISKYASGLAVNNVGIISINQNPRLRKIARKEVAQPHSLGCSGPGAKSVTSEPRDSDYVHINAPLWSIERSEAVEVFVYTDVRV